MRKYARIFVLGDISSSKLTVFRELRSRKTVSFEEQISPRTNIQAYFQGQMEAIVLIILQIFIATRTVLKIGEYSQIFPFQLGNIRSCDVFRPIFDGL